MAMMTISDEHGSLIAEAIALRNGTNAANAALHDHEWSRFLRLLFISNVATFASIGNIFTISAIIIDDLLRKKGNSFLVSSTLADMLITTVVLPASSAAILAEMEDSENLCHFQYGVSSIACLTAALFMAVVGIENYLRLKTLRKVEYSRARQPSIVAGGGSNAASRGAVGGGEKQSICTVFQVTVLNLVIWLVSGVTVLIHFIFMPHLMYAICGPPGGWKQTNVANEQSLLASVTVLGVCLLSFILIGGLGFLKCICIMKSWDKPKPYLTSREFAVVSANIWNWLLRFLIWCPSLVWAIISQSQRLIESQEEFGTEVRLRGGGMNLMQYQDGFVSRTYFREQQDNHLRSFTNEPAMNGLNNSSLNSAMLNAVFQRMIIWPVILPPCLSSLINALANKDFRRCYIQLFQYCCCKTSVALTHRPRDSSRGGSDVRVHIIPGYNMYSSTAGHFSEISAAPTFNSRGFKCRPLMHCKRDVYEL